ENLPSGESAAPDEGGILSSVLRNLPVVIYRGYRDWSIRFVGENNRVLTGYDSRDFLEGKVRWTCIVHPGDRGKIRDANREAVAKKKELVAIRYRITHRDGSIRWVEDRRKVTLDGGGRFLHVDGVLTDITEIIHLEKQVRAREEALRESEERYRSLVEESLVGVYLIEDGLFRFVNRRFCEIFGYDFDEIVGRLGPLDLTHPDDRDLVRENIAKRLRGEVRSIEYEFTCVKKDGTAFPVRVMGNRCDVRGRPAIIGTLIDLTRERELERQFLQAQKMDAIGKLAGGIAHDMNNYLSAVTGYGELLKMICPRECRNSEKIMKNVEGILSVSEKAARLISQILAFSRRQVARPRVIDVNETIQEMEGMLRRLIGEDISFSVSLYGEPIPVKMDPAQLEQVFVNLVVNARDAMPEGGTIFIETETRFVDKQSRGKRTLMPEGDYAVISVTDTGVGIPKEIQGKIFDPFFTTKPKGKGTGLGLSTVYGIVKQNNGFIWVYSEPGEGTTFRIYLPLVREGDEVSGGKEGDSPLLEKGEGTILLVEDNEEIRLLTRDLLVTLGYTVETASSGEEALKILEGKKDVDLLITDFILPGMRGYHLAERAKKLVSSLKVLYISGYTDDYVASRGLLPEGVKFLSKPFTLSQLSKAVREAMGKENS
ncbi:MAG: PAS domain-containing sensor histidine kinase, partial [Deltaproteobacteria bacterium]